jgi:hypothetical protein
MHATRPLTGADHQLCLCLAPDSVLTYAMPRQWGSINLVQGWDGDSLQANTHSLPCNMYNTYV